jgi:hypothetical protein
MVHAAIVIPLALRTLSSETLRKDPVFGYDPAVGDLLAFTSGFVHALYSCSRLTSYEASEL